jgi:hypothetical protein
LSALASPIFVANFSFELPGGPLPIRTCGTGCSFSAGAIPGWTGSTATSGEFQPGTQVGNLAYFSTLTDGISVAYSDLASPITQTVAPTVQVGVTYTLMIDIGKRNDVTISAFKGSADLLINGHHIAAVGVTPTTGHWSTYTATYVGLSADAGKPITIELLSSGKQADFDNVRLSSAAITSAPEPGGVTLLGLGLVGLSLFTRRKRTA